MQEVYKRAFLQTAPEVLGVQLRPFSIGHAFLLEAFDSPYIGIGAQTLEELVFAVWVCSLPFEDGIARTIAPTRQDERRLRRWGRRAVKLDWLEERHRFNEYVQDYLTMPRTWQKGQTGQAKVPYALAIMLRMNGGRLDERLWDTPLSRALCYSTVAGFLKGDVDPVSEAEERVIFEEEDGAQPMAKARVRGEMDLDSRKFNRGIKGAKDSVGKFGTQLGGLKSKIAGAFAAGAIGGGFVKLLKKADEIDNIAKKLNLSAESAQSLKIKLDDAGIGISSLETVMRKLTSTQERAISEGGRYAETFEKLGIGMDEVRRSSPEQLLNKVARAMRAGRGSADIMSAATEALGERSISLRQVLFDVAEKGLGALNAANIESAKIMRDTTVKALDEAEQKWTDYQRRITVGAAETLGVVDRLGAAAGRLFGGGKVSRIKDQSFVLRATAEMNRQRKADVLAAEKMAATMGASGDTGAAGTGMIERAGKPGVSAFGDLRKIGANMLGFKSTQFQPPTEATQVKMLHTAEQINSAVQDMKDGGGARF